MYHTPRRLPTSPMILRLRPGLGRLRPRPRLRPLPSLLLACVIVLAAACASSDVQQPLDGAVDQNVPADGSSDQLETDTGADLGVGEAQPDAVHGSDAQPDALSDASPADLAPLGDAGASTWQQVKSFGTNPGDLDMFVYAPAGLPAKAPLVVVLHPCQIVAKSFGNNAGWNRLADLRKFVVLYPEQSYSNNLTLCFNWFESGDTKRGGGEIGSIEQMIAKVKTLYGIDDARIYVSGLSAGGAMTAALLAAYPDIFAGGAIFAGVPAGCATSVFSSASCMFGVDKTASEWATKAKAAFPGYSGSYPKVSIFHGSSDVVVYPKNRQELVEQWTGVHGADTTADTSQTVGDVTRETFNDAQGFPQVTSYTISGMPHGIPVDPGTAPDKGGTTGIGYYDVDLWGAWRAAEDWGI
jgi:poly(hydroxyalkanoate) depolymerase family esterase